MLLSAGYKPFLLLSHTPYTHTQVFAKFDTSIEKLEPLSAELNVKALPVFKFYKVGVLCFCVTNNA